MRPRKWMQIAAVASAMGLAGTAIANDMGASSTPIDQSSTMSSPSTNQGGAVSSPSTDQNGYPLSATSDLDRSVPAATGLSGNASSSSSSDLTGSAATANEVNGMAPSSTANDLSAPSRSDDAAAGATGGTTQGSTMESPKPAMSSGAGASAATSGHERLANTNSDNFNAWASDYASQHEGRITRQEFLDHMGQRFDQLDTQHQGSLTPYQVEEILIVTPASPASATSSMPSATGNGANADTSNSTLR